MNSVNKRERIKPGAAPIEYIGIIKEEEPNEKPIEKMLTAKSSDKPVILSEGFSTDICPADKETVKNLGLIYEVAEELYIKEKTAAEIEALAGPPFHKNFDEITKERLDKNASRRTVRVLSSARDSAYRPAFLPDTSFEETSKPMETKQALLTELLMLVPFINIAAAVFVIMDPGANKNLRSFCRAFLIITGVVMILLTGILLGLMFNR